MNPTSTDRETLPASPAPPPSLAAVLVMVGVWWGAIVAHFLLCGVCGYLLGNPVELPFWLRPWDELFTYGISGFLAVVLIAVWWLVVAAAFVPFCFVAWYVSRGLHRLLAERESKVEPDSAFWLALGVLGPMLGMSLLSLLILPMQAPHHTDSESGLELAEQVSYAAFAEYQFLSLFAMFVILVLFGVLFGGAGVVATYAPESGMFVFFSLILMSIAASMGAGLLLGPIVLQLPHRYGVYQATAIAFAGLGLLTGTPMLLMLRSGK
ncbi:MAG: hypothetical protein K8U03_24290 [Planctomycetia bacterium]|nr:hypothetical protein [Planctomycetia bacterium]